MRRILGPLGNYTRKSSALFQSGPRRPFYLSKNSPSISASHSSREFSSTNNKIKPNSLGVNSFQKADISWAIIGVFGACGIYGLYRSYCAPVAETVHAQEKREPKQQEQKPADTTSATPINTPKPTVNSDQQRNAMPTSLKIDKSVVAIVALVSGGMLTFYAMRRGLLPTVHWENGKLIFKTKQAKPEPQKQTGQIVRKNTFDKTGEVDMHSPDPEWQEVSGSKFKGDAKITMRQGSASSSPRPGSSR